jgi:hypothetical protein
MHFDSKRTVSERNPYFQVLRIGFAASLQEIYDKYYVKG